MSEVERSALGYMMKFPSFEELTEVVRNSSRLRRDERIDPDTQFRDLSITGKHGLELLKVVERHYGIEFKPDLYDRMQTEGLVRSEATDEFPVIQPLLGSSVPTGQLLTVGQLYKATLQGLSTLPDAQQHTRE